MPVPRVSTDDKSTSVAAFGGLRRSAIFKLFSNGLWLECLKTNLKQRRSLLWIIQHIVDTIAFHFNENTSTPAKSVQQLAIAVLHATVLYQRSLRGASLVEPLVPNWRMPDTAQGRMRAFFLCFFQPISSARSCKWPGSTSLSSSTTCRSAIWSEMLEFLESWPRICDRGESGSLSTPERGEILHEIH